MLHELARRDESDVLVRLLWDSDEDRTVLRYRDRRSGDAFVTEVPKRQALDAFRHPNVYRPARLAA
jgi:hypothetical protein